MKLHNEGAVKCSALTFKGSAVSTLPLQNDPTTKINAAINVAKLYALSEKNGS